MASLGNLKIQFIDLRSNDKINEALSQAEAKLTNPVNLDVSSLEVRNSIIFV